MMIARLSISHTFDQHQVSLKEAKVVPGSLNQTFDQPQLKGKEADIFFHHSFKDNAQKL